MQEKIAKREADIELAAAEYDAKRAAFIERAILMMTLQIEQLRIGKEPDTGWTQRGDHIYVDVGLEYPTHPKIEEDESIRKMRRHASLLEMAVDDTVLVDPDGEYKAYL